MEYKRLFFLLIIVIFVFQSCEKDDICAEGTPTTPRMVIEFYDRQNTTVLKNVANLKVIGMGQENGIVFNPQAQGESRYYVNDNTIKIPLKTFENSTTYRFIINADLPSANEDIFTLNYSRNDIYISKACGFKTLFLLNSENIIPTNPEGDNNLWIESIEIFENNINNEEDIHLKIYF